MDWTACLQWFEEGAKLAPIGTAIIAGIAATIAVCSLRTQARMAKKKATIDVFLRIEMDSNTIAAHKTYTEALERLPKDWRFQGGWERPTDEDYSRFEQEESEACQNICSYLNVHKLIASGIHSGAFADQTCFEFWCIVLIWTLALFDRRMSWIRTHKTSFICV